MLKDIDKNACKCTIEKEINSLKQLEVLLGDSVLSNVLDLLQNAPGRIIFTGMGKSGIIARKVVASLSSTGSPALFVHPAEGRGLEFDDGANFEASSFKIRI